MGTFNEAPARRQQTLSVSWVLKASLAAELLRNFQLE